MPFDVFEEWFTTQLVPQIAHSKSKDSGFDIAELIETHESIFNEEWASQQQNGGVHGDTNCHVQ